MARRVVEMSLRVEEHRERKREDDNYLRRPSVSISTDNTEEPRN